MPGAYTHITLVNEATARTALDAVPGFPAAAIAACGRWKKFCELGVVSPDYPYLRVGHEPSKRWADLMHYRRTDGMIRAGIERLRTMSGPARDKGLAWLLGYAAHVVMDVTIHPVINARVGPYEQNATEHRICEMNQDVYIFPRLNLAVGLSEHLDSGIKTCSDGASGLDADIRALWTDALAAAYPDDVKANPPEPDSWHWWFCQAVDKIAENNGWLAAIARHVAPGQQLTYPTPAEIDWSYIKDLPTPRGGRIHFDALFDEAKRNVHRIWRTVAAGALGLDETYREVLTHWDLDSGKDVAGELVFWRTA